MLCGDSDIEIQLNCNPAAEPNSLRGEYYGAAKTTCLGVTCQLAKSDIAGWAGGGIAS